MGNPMEKRGHPLGSVLEAIQDPFFILDQQGAFQEVNRRGSEILGYSWEELRRKVFYDLVSPEDIDPLQKAVELMRQNREVRLGISILSRSGERIPVEFFGMTKGEVSFVTLRNLSEKIQKEHEWERVKKELMEKIRERDQYALELQAMKDLYKEKLKEIEKLREEGLLLSYTDDLTGVFNHRYFIHYLTREVDKQKRYLAPLSLLMIDIDYFKHYNDTNGHLAGDQVLRAIAYLIEHAVRQSDVVARYGGEEFAAILINAEKEDAKEIAERVRKSIAETRFPNEATQPHGKLTVSIGVATFSSSTATLTDLIREADNALYRAKRAGRDRVED